MLASARGAIAPRLVGVNKASTFSGFCSHHDSALFAPIETSPLRVCDEHAFLLALRAVSYELYAKEAGVLSFEGNRLNLDCGFPESMQVKIQSDVRDHLTGFTAGLQDVRHTKAELDEMYARRDFSEMEYCAFWLDRPPDLMCCGSDSPQFDFRAMPLQNLGNLDVRMQMLTCSLLASEDRGCAFFSWTAGCRTVSRAFLRSLINLRPRMIADAILQYVLTNFENVYMRPDWWEALDQKLQAYIVERFHYVIHPETPINPRILVDDGVRVAHWSVTGLESNVLELTSTWDEYSTDDRAL